MNITELDKTYVANTYGRFPVEVAYGKGSELWDTEGKRYIDMGSGIGVTAFGIADDRWQKDVISQIMKVQHTSNLYYTEPCAKLAELLCKKTGMKKVFFGNSGAEANECAIKVARRWAEENKGAEYNTVITLKNSFHGRTIATLAATGQDVFHEHFGPFPEGFVYAEAGNTEELRRLAKENKCAAIMFECVQGEGGVIALSREFVDEIVKVANEENLLLIADEVQTGNGRTGETYAFMHYGITPDIVSTAKGLGGGLPIGACILGERVENTLRAGDHGSTYGGNPVCAAGAVSVISRIDEALLAEVREKSKIVFNFFNGVKGVESITGMGLMIGIKTEKKAKEVVSDCISKGVLCLTAKDKVRLLPALNIPKSILLEALEIIKESL